MQRTSMACLIALSLSWLSGCGDLDPVDYVHDLRLLAVRAEPPDQALSVGPELTVSQGASDVQITALVADPNGQGPQPHLQFWGLSKA